MSKTPALKTQAIALAALAFDASSNSGEVQLLPDGDFTAKDGRPGEGKSWKLNAEIAAAVIKRTSLRKNRAVIDYEHQTLWSRDNGKPAPAAGWFDKLIYRPGLGMFAAVEWTESAGRAIQAGEYRYVSAVFAYNANTGEVIEIFHAALTNWPAIDGMQELVAAASQFFTRETSMSTSNQGDQTPQPNEHALAVLAAAGFTDPAQVTQEQADAVVARLSAGAEGGNDAEQHVATLTKQLAERDTQIAALKQSNVPAAQYTELQNELAALKQSVEADQRGELITAALADGRLQPGLKEWAEQQPVAALRVFLQKAQPIAALSGQQSQGSPGAGNTEGLTDEQLAVCKATGTSPKDFAAALKAEQGESNPSTGA